MPRYLVSYLDLDGNIVERFIGAPEIRFLVNRLEYLSNITADRILSIFNTNEMELD